jgi:hypothetical protein
VTILRTILTASILIASAFVCAAVSAGPSLENSMKVEEVARLNPAHADSDARSAVARGDKRLLAVYGYTIEIPGMHDDPEELKAKYGLRMLEGTSDSYQNSRDKQFNDKARRYASIYNRAVSASFK